MAAKKVYVSITGLELKGWTKTFRFYWHAIRSFRQVKASEGNISAEVKAINGVQHTLTVWDSERAMRRFLYQGAHKEAIKAFPDIATGKTFGFETDRVPSWDEVPTLWAEHGREYEI